MCPGCECVLAFPAKLDWLTVLSENVSSMWVLWNFLPNWTSWHCSLKCVQGVSVLEFSAKLEWMTVLSENVSSLWVCFGISCQPGLADSAIWNVSSVWVCPEISCQTGLANSAFWKCVQRVSVFWDCLPNWTGWQCSLKMCPDCECVLAFPAKVDWLTVLSENVSSMWVSWDFLPNWTGWPCSLKMCPGCECVLEFSAKLNWLTVLSENVSRVWVCPGIFCQTGLADSALW